ncbi:MAG: sensor domain-containing diguanylate cyclase [Chthoniobacterales bacterium]
MPFPKPDSAIHSPLGKKIVRLYAATLITSLLALGIYLHTSWSGLREKALSDLEKDARITSRLIHDSLRDAGKLLAIARIQIENQSKEGLVDPRKAHNILKETVDDFSLYRETQSMGLLLYLDRSGTIVAQNGIYPTQPIPLSDRLYFRILRENPTMKFAIGNLVEARTTGKAVFHMAFPIRDVKGRLAGVLSQQIDGEEIAGALGAVIHEPGVSIIAMVPSGEPAFIFPLPKNPERLDITADRELLRFIPALGKDFGVIRIPRGKAGQQAAVYAGYNRDTRDGICSVAILHEADLIREFFSKHLNELTISLVLGILISILFIGLYRQSDRLFEALFASRHDQLTGLGNRRAAEEVCTRLWSDSKRRLQQISVLFMDIDHFKDFNDTYGHDVGDEVLKSVAECIRSSSRRPLDYCFRWGGEEFVAVLPETGKRAALHLANCIQECVHRITFTDQGISFPPITLSIGIATSLLEGNENQHRLFARADKAMLRAKRAGRDRVLVE